MAYVELSLPRRRWIADLGEAAFMEAGGIIPCQPTTIIEDCSITLSMGDYGNAFDGLIEHVSGRFHIYCNTRETDHPTSSRVRFTIGHELGHFFIDEHRLALASGRVPSHPSFIDKTGQSVVETEANTFASYFLLPQQAFRNAVNQTKAGLKSLLDIASTFHVSAQATVIRYVEEGQLPCAAVMFRPDKKAWAAISPALRKLGYEYLAVTEAAKLPDGFASKLAFQAPAINGLSQIFETPSTASFWFKNVSHASTRNCVIVEQAVRLGPYGVLTLLLFSKL
jgi:Zn-dependent peptidase ImmA (M78 family)